MDEKEKEREDLLDYIDDTYPPLDFSNIPNIAPFSYNVAIFDFILDFHGDDDSAAHHITFFIKAVVDFNRIHEHDLMWVFACLLVGGANDWFLDDLPIKCISSLSSFFHLFLEKWHHGDTHNIENLIEKFLTHLSNVNHIESPGDHPVNYEEHIRKDPIEEPFIEETLEECNESLTENIYDEILEESFIQTPIKECQETFENFENHVFKISNCETCEKFETFEGETIYDSSSDESTIIENDE